MQRLRLGKYLHPSFHLLSGILPQVPTGQTQLEAETGATDAVHRAGQRCDREDLNLALVWMPQATKLPLPCLPSSHPSPSL